MATRMLIDARHTEETRVAVLKGNRIEEFDFESADHKQIKGNIYLAKVTRVEPSLQAAFVDFGGNRHGFLAFGEIHPDYYQIPKEDRERLLAEEQAHAEEEAALRAAEDEDEARFGPSDEDEDDDAGVEEIDTSEKDDVATIEDGHLENGADDGSEHEDGETVVDEEGEPDTRGRGRRGRGRRQGKGGQSRAKEMDDLRARRQALRRRYKIQDVIQRRQVLLVQVVKEERGNKGAALTTYLSLAGRYCVLMPNSSHGGGISRKISSSGDRKRLKSIVSDLKLPKAMGLIVRTAGLQRTKPEIKRDFDYLARLWDEIRENTLKSTAPALIHSDSDLIKRAIRDIYNREIEEVVVEGEEGYRSAREFMKLLMPSHARRVKAYSDPVPLFQRYGAEDELSAMYEPIVQLKSGGYIVINPTEALVSIDINSGRSTKEHGIEQTALSTNLEAAKEIARQLRLRDMAGLVVIDFIDMEYGSNVRKVEKCMKDALKNDRARIQVGRISGFGLMEMSRQRLRTGVLEASTRQCPHCDGTGLVRTASSAGLSALRLIEDEAAKGKGSTISLYASTEAAIYLLNAKRADLAEIEDRYGVSVEVVPEGEDEGAKMRVASSGPRPTTTPKFEPIVDDDDDLEIEDEELEEEDDEEERQERRDDSDRQNKRRRRRGGRGRSKRDESDRSDDRPDDRAQDSSDEDGEAESSDRPERSDEEGDEDRPKRRRRRRGGRGRNKRRDEGDAGENAEETSGDQFEDTAEAAAQPAETAPDAGVGGETEGRPARRSRRKKPVEEATEQAPADPDQPSPPASEGVEAPVEEKPKRRSRKKKDDEEVAPVADVVEAPAEEAAPPKRSRRKKAEVTEAAEPQAVEAETPVEAPAPKARKSRAKAAEAPVADNDANGAEGQPDEPAADGTARRGWWQRTFGE
ncbi:MAG: Rne/Rng family ribonuclease [Croceibacterium sp.]